VVRVRRYHSKRVELKSIARNVEQSMSAKR
jgi:hypothetical protein